MVIENRYVENASRFVINFLFIQNFLSSIKDEYILFGKNNAWVKSFNAFFPSKIDTFLSVKEKSCNKQQYCSSSNLSNHYVLNYFCYKFGEFEQQNLIINILSQNYVNIFRISFSRTTNLIAMSVTWNSGKQIEITINMYIFIMGKHQKYD